MSLNCSWTFNLDVKLHIKKLNQMIGVLFILGCCGNVFPKTLLYWDGIKKKMMTWKRYRMGNKNWFKIFYRQFLGVKITLYYISRSPPLIHIHGPIKTILHKTISRFCNFSSFFLVTVFNEMNWLCVMLKWKSSYI